MKVTSAPPPTAQQFEAEIKVRWQAAQRAGQREVTLVSGEIHRAIGGYPGSDNRMPSCCRVMKRLMQPGDEIVRGPASGQGARLAIRYKLPRP